MIRDYKKIVAWERAHELTLAVYEHTRPFPADERYGLTSQLRRAAYSAPANIAEGSGRNTKREYLRFLYIALGSLREAEYFLLLAYELGYLQETEYKDLTDRVNRALGTLQGLVKAVTKEVGIVGRTSAKMLSFFVLTLGQYAAAPI